MTPRKRVEVEKVDEKVHLIPIAITDRQMHILKLTQAGVSQSEIARLLGVTRQSVQKVVRQLRQKGLLD